MQQQSGGSWPQLDHASQPGRQEEAHGAQQADKDEEPEEDAVDDHSHELPVRLHLRRVGDAHTQSVWGDTDTWTVQGHRQCSPIGTPPRSLTGRTFWNWNCVVSLLCRPHLNPGMFWVLPAC